MIAKTPAEYAAWKEQQQPRRVCKVCGPTNNDFPRKGRTCRPCKLADERKRQWMHRHRYEVIG